MCVEERFGTQYRAIHQASDDRDKYAASPRRSRVALKREWIPPIMWKVLATPDTPPRPSAV